MKDVITQKDEVITPEIFESRTEEWCREDVLKLAHHFHKFEKTKGQYHRVARFDMKQGNLEEFKAIGKIEKLTVFLSLKEGYREKLTFSPILKVIYDGNKSKEYELKPKTKLDIEQERIEKGGGKIATEIVPDTFKEMICKNWEDAEIHIIDDLFHCWGKKDPEDEESIIRVERFEVDRMVEYIDGLRNSLLGVSLYPGIDMNKFNKKNMISFTPVLGFQMDGSQHKEKSELGLKGVFELASNEIFAEYSRPCPPTCIDPPN
ncbi:hypothetical protein [Aquimarina algiphila]|uniref:hypothetical protein n=1 Tax=Aquimarina algiphila TaxID=2047982 RepID=UPI0023305CC9|nr:hypothetical protein [Aquimarina algiphila]